MEQALTSVSNSETLEVMENILIHFFKLNPKIRPQASEIPWGDIEIHGIYYIRVYCQYYATDEDRLEEIIPNISPWANLILKYVNQAVESRVEQQEFFVAEMLKTAAHLDLSDESGRRRLTEISSTLIFNRQEHILVNTSFSASVIKQTVNLLKKVCSDGQSYLSLVEEILNEIMLQGTEVEAFEKQLIEFKAVEVLLEVLRSTSEVLFSLIVDSRKRIYYALNGVYCISCVEITPGSY